MRLVDFFAPFSPIWCRRWRLELQTLAAGVGLWTAVAAGAAGPSAASPESVRRSEQFIVVDARRFGRSLTAYANDQNPEMLQLEPETLLISAERIREALVRQLRISPRGGGQIRCQLYAPVRNNE